jgi:hypothetical protein
MRALPKAEQAAKNKRRREREHHRRLAEDPAPDPYPSYLRGKIQTKKMSDVCFRRPHVRKGS